MKVYIAGPMTGKLNLNFQNFFEAEQALQEAGYKTLNPARMDIERYGGWPPPGGYPKINVKDVAWIDLHVIIKQSDGIVLLPGWEDSPGARAERAVAEWIGIAVMTLEEALRGRSD